MIHPLCDGSVGLLDITYVAITVMIVTRIGFARRRRSDLRTSSISVVAILTVVHLRDILRSLLAYGTGSDCR
jgi:hypothetical protein